MAVTLVIIVIFEFICILRFGFADRGHRADHGMPRKNAISLLAKEPSSAHRQSQPKGEKALAEEETQTPNEPSKPNELRGKWLPSVCRNENITWAVDGIQIHLLAFRRPQSLFVLMEQLRSANYKSIPGWDQEVPLYIHVDADADPLVTHIAQSAVWPHGPLVADVREKRHGARDMWLSSVAAAAREAGDNTLLVVFEDDMRVSSAYFQYLLRMVREYGKNPACRNSSLFGFSLSPVRLMEMRAGRPFERWRAKNVLPESMPWQTYVAGLPSTWGGAYWSDRWNEFADFVAVRSLEPYYHREADNNSNRSAVKDSTELSPLALQVPGSSSNDWAGGWKRFLVDFMYGCGLVMMYPNLEGENALATTLGLKSSADRTSDSRIKAPTRNLWQRVPRVAPLFKGDMDVISTLRLPDFSSLQAVDLFMQLSTFEEVGQTAHRFISGITAHAEFSELAGAWCSKARLRVLMR